MHGYAPVLLMSFAAPTGAARRCALRQPASSPFSLLRCVCAGKAIKVLWGGGVCSKQVNIAQVDMLHRCFSLKAAASLLLSLLYRTFAAAKVLCCFPDNIFLLSACSLSL